MAVARPPGGVDVRGDVREPDEGAVRTRIARRRIGRFQRAGDVPGVRRREAGDLAVAPVEEREAAADRAADPQEAVVHEGMAVLAEGDEVGLLRPSTPLAPVLVVHRDVLPRAAADAAAAVAGEHGAAQRLGSGYVAVLQHCAR